MEKNGMAGKGRDPSTDFRGAGFVSLENFLFFAKTFSTSFLHLVKKQGGERATWEYPFAVAGVNITFMLIQMLGKGQLSLDLCSCRCYQRMQQNLMVSCYSGRPDSFPTKYERQYASNKAESQWQWDRDAQQMSPQLYNDGQGGNAGRSYYPNQMIDTKMVSNHEQIVHTQEQDMEVGYEDSPTRQTLERLDQKSHDDIMNFMKEQDVAEDAENARHRETGRGPGISQRNVGLAQKIWRSAALLNAIILLSIGLSAFSIGCCEGNITVCCQSLLGFIEAY